jgi:hypothetical protein
MVPTLFIQRHGAQGYIISLAQYHEILRHVQDAQIGDSSLGHYPTREICVTHFRDAVRFSQAGMESLQKGLDGITPEQSISYAVISDEDCQRLLEKGFYSFYL